MWLITILKIVSLPSINYFANNLNVPALFNVLVPPYPSPSEMQVHDAAWSAFHMEEKNQYSSL